MLKERPDHHDAELVIKLYELRRESVMRESRGAINAKFWPKSYEEFLAVTKADHPLNAAFRQTGSYWEMVYGMARHGVVHVDFLLDSNGEGLFLFARVHAYVEQYRTVANPNAFRNAEWVATQTEAGKRIFEMFRARVEQRLAQPTA